MKVSKYLFAAAMVVISVFFVIISVRLAALEFPWNLLPSLPFIFLGLGSLLTRRFCPYAFTCSAIGALGAIGIPYILLTYSLAHDIGANIGLGLVFLAMPLYVPVVMFFGWMLGKKYSHR